MTPFLKILDLYSGTGSVAKVFRYRGHEAITLDNDPRFETDHIRDIFTVTAEELTKRHGQFDFIWASPPCEAFSVASIGHHWGGGDKAYEPKTEHAKLSMNLVQHTVALIAALAPTYGWMMENPRGVLRKMPIVQALPRQTVTYCQYGDTRMKPTDLWGRFPEGLEFKPMCKNGDPCHESAPRGSKTGTQGLSNAIDRSVIPPALIEDIADALEIQKARATMRRAA